MPPWTGGRYGGVESIPAGENREKESMNMKKTNIVGAIAGLALTSAAFAGPTYLTQMRYVEATVNGGGDMVDMERRVSMDFGGFDRTASASLSLPGGASGSSTVTQTSTFDDSGVTANFSGAFSTGGTGLTSTVKTVLESTFVLEGPSTYQFFPYGGSPSLVGSGTGTASLVGTTSASGPDLDISLQVADGQAIGDTSGEPFTGELAGGTYTFKYEFDGTASDAGLNFSFAPSLLFDAVTPGGDNGGPAVIPLPNSAVAGLGTLAGIGGLGLIGRLRRKDATA